VKQSQTGEGRGSLPAGSFAGKVFGSDAIRRFERCFLPLPERLAAVSLPTMGRETGSFRREDFLLMAGKVLNLAGISSHALSRGMTPQEVTQLLLQQS
jgi:hypothetical protein